MKPAKFLAVIFTVIVFFACNKSVIYSEFYVVPEFVGWSKDSVFTFGFDVEDTVLTYELDFLVRNTDNFPNQNLWLEIVKEHDGKIFIDSVNVFLSDDYGRWRGKGIGSYYDSQLIYKQNVKFYKSGRYTYKIRHLMRVEQLFGIKSFGLQVCREK
ncbi:MAG: gliding motility lipoprotein GldH, partial [Prevotellaceae bacterium]|jgi:gliding motility-associated lipoprotein GldH|nr:gliding motility lipoprotein GldH [Prevotellaceae bacterium]